MKIPFADEKSIDILCLGEPLFEFAERADGLWQSGFGGDVSNTAVAAARQGARSAVATRLGVDSFGDELMRLWETEGVSTRAVVRDPDAPTGVYFIRQTPDGHVFEYRRIGSAASLMRPETLPLDLLRDCRVLHVTGVSQAISESAEATVDAAIAEAKAAGALISFDPNLRLRLWPLDRAVAAAERVLAHADLVLPGLDDALQMTGMQTPEDVVRYYLDRGPSVVALTMGAEGALIATPSSDARIPSRKAELVDASGAGDCFDGAFLAEWLRREDPVVAGRYAAIAASLSVEGYGAVGPIPKGERVRWVLAQTI